MVITYFILCYYDESVQGNFVFFAYLFFPWLACRFEIFNRRKTEKKNKKWPYQRRKRKRSDSVLCQKPLHPQKNPKATGQHKNATKIFDYTTIADRIRTVSWSNSSHPTGVVKPVYERLNLPTHRKSSVINSTWHDRNIVYHTNRLSQRWVHV